ncbi:hypothetical protein HMPREF1210_01156 [Paenisporosarcina sp. HGH0030]|uniref:hypothetical protein n=1 Tax=Paenisporosarcina sp. HGH0030 TaxID=1078085 RepID=UPI00034E6C95|nr:hypothetical protein [Paenisporosarcina sp. HGH0030]EPD52776.1 hypothetical protein HMPREF1210_01156 [Paenisporosarcina sp. HGH0030]
MNDDNTHEINLIKLKIHFKYCISFLIAISCLVGGLALFNQKTAITGLSNASLLLSIVLAIIAILITLWDVSGQKQNVYDMKKEIEKLKKIVDKSSSFSEELETGLTKIEGMNNENLTLLSSLHELMKGIKPDDKPEEFYEKVEELLKNNFSHNENLNNMRNSKEFSGAKNEIVAFVLSNSVHQTNEIKDYFKMKYPNHIILYREALAELLYKKEIIVGDNGEFEYRF